MFGYPDDQNTLPRVWYSISNKSVSKEKIEMKVGLILCKCFTTYPNSVSVLISFVFSSWIINEFEMPGSPIVVITHFFLATIKLYWQEELSPPYFAGGGGLGVCGFMSPSSPCSVIYCIIILIQNDVVLFLGAVLISQLHSKHSHKTLQMPPLLWFTFNLWYNCLGLPL